MLLKSDDGRLTVVRCLPQINSGNRRKFNETVGQKIFPALREMAGKEHRPIKQLASEIVRQELCTA